MAGKGRTCGVVWSEFKQHTSSHGLPHIARAKGSVRRILWVIINLLSLAVLSWHAAVLFKAYLRYDVHTVAATKSEPALEFPAVTICNQNAMRVSELHRFPTILDVLEMYGIISTNRRKAIAHMTSPATNQREAPPVMSEQSTSIPKKRIDGYYKYSTGSRTSTPKPYFERTRSYPSTSSPPLPQSSTPRDNSSWGTRQNTTHHKEPHHDEREEKGEEEQPHDHEEEPVFNPLDVDRLDGDIPCLNTELQTRITKIVASLDDGDRDKLGYQLEDFVLECEYDGITCDIRKRFHRLHNPRYGNCFTFNFGRNQHDNQLLSTIPGVHNGLHLTLNINVSEYIGVNEAVGARVVIHAQNQMPFPEMEGILLSPRESTDIAMQLSVLERSANNCVDSESDEHVARDAYQELYDVDYSDVTCLRTCRQQHFMTHCGCAHPDYPHKGQTFEQTRTRTLHDHVVLCDIANNEQRSCMRTVTSSLGNNTLSCECPPPCKEKQYKLLVSTAQLSTKYYQTYLRRGGSDTVFPVSKFQNHFAKVNIYYQSHSYDSIAYRPVYDFSKFISDLGAVFGLYIGFSVITLLEFVEFGLDFMMASIVPVFCKRTSYPIHPTASYSSEVTLNKPSDGVVLENVPMPAPPISVLPMSAPPMSAPPMSAPHMSAPPMSPPPPYEL